MKRFLTLLLVTALTVSLLAGCRTEKSPYTPTGDGLTWDEQTTPTSGITEQDLSLPYFPDRSLNPYKCGDYINQNVFDLVYQSLFVVDAEYNVYPVLCSGYKVSKDMKTYTFYLAEATFPDGDVLTSADVVASLKTAMKSNVYKGRFGYVKSVKTSEDGGVEVTLTTPYENFPILLDVPIVKQSQTDEARPLGTGPYLYETREDQLRLRRRTDWWCAAALPVTAEYIRLVEGENAAQLRDEFEFSGLGLVTADPGSSGYVDFHSDNELWDSENGIFLYLACNKASEVLSNQSIRAALTYAIDRDKIAAEQYRGFAYAAVLPASPKSPWYDTALAQKYGYAPEKLTQAVAQAGVTEIPITLLVNTDDSIRLRAARKIAQSLKQCGLKVTTAELNGADYLAALEKGEFDLYLGQTRLSANMDLSAFFAEEGALNFGGIRDTAMYALCLDALANSGNYYTLHQEILEDGMLCPILLRSYAIFAQRGQFSSLTPARDNVFFYHLGKTVADAKITEE